VLYTDGVKVVLAALVKARGAAGTTVRVKVWETVPAVFDAAKMREYVPAVPGVLESVALPLP
jgi:hypothetical protein